MEIIEAAFYQDWDNKIFKKLNGTEFSNYREELRSVRMASIMGATNPTKRNGKYHFDDFSGTAMLLFCNPDKYDLTLADVDF